MKQSKQQVIPVHRMDAQTPLGIELGHLDAEDVSDELLIKSNKNMAHRDDYYMFLFLDKGEASFTIDFEEMQLTGCVVFYVCPGQVHSVLSIRKTKGWALAIDSMLVEKDCKNIFEGQFLTQRSVVLDAPVAARLNETARLLHTSIHVKQTTFSNRIILNLANVFIGMIAEQYADRLENLQRHKSRAALITHQFKKMLSENFKTLKNPTQYAKTLNYSLSHLNESVKSVTGFPVSYWIHQQVVLEAKRLLYYTSMDVKEIAFSLGYEDHTYFSRLFSKTVGISPGAFRQKFHE